MENGTYTTCNKEILHEQYTFYIKLYKNDSIPEEKNVNYLYDVKNLNILSEEEAQLLEGEISNRECYVAIKNMKLNKSSGSDGIPVEFYLTFWTDIKDLLLDYEFSLSNRRTISISKKGNIKFDL